VEAPSLDPEAVTKTLGISASRHACRGDERRNFNGDVIGVHECGWWKLSSKDVVVSKDINDHFRFLLDRLLPFREEIISFAEGGETYFDVLWESTYLYAGTGPLLDAASIAGAAALHAGMGFDIYQIDEDAG
jgi:hypothetical protein